MVKTCEMAGMALHAQLPARRQSKGADAHQPGSPRLDASQTQRQVPDRAGRDVQSVHSRLDHLLQPFLQDAIASHSQADRRLCHPVGTPQVQADAPSDQGCKRLVRPVPPSESQAPRPLVAMPWQRPNNRSRMNREVHVRFWESPEVKVLRATRRQAEYHVEDASARGSEITATSTVIPR